MAKKEPLDLEAFYKSLDGKNALPLEPGSPFYVPIHTDRAKDPILELRTRIKYTASESVHLLTGFRGNGKSTELRRLKKLLEDQGNKVFLVDMLDYMIMTKPVELSDFILSLMAALAEAVKEEADLDAVREGYWERLSKFLQSEVELDGVKIGTSEDAVKAELALKLKTDPSFKQAIQKHLCGLLTTLVEQAREFVIGVVGALRKREKNPDLKVVFLVDSLERLRGVGRDAPKVYESVVELFSAQAPNLSLPLLHVVYTIPPYLTPMAGNISRGFGGHPISSWPNVHVRDDKGGDDDKGMEIMEALIAKRYPGWTTVFDRAHLRRLARSSGGDIRNYFSLVRECLVLLDITKRTRVEESMLIRVEQQLQMEITPLAADDALWLARIHDSKTTALKTIEDLPRLARFLDGNLIMNYQNGHPWYDVHPLLLDEIERHVKEDAARRAAEAQSAPGPRS